MMMMDIFMSKYNDQYSSLYRSGAWEIDYNVQVCRHSRMTLNVIDKALNV